MHPKITVLVISWNTCGILRSCLSQIAIAAGDLEYEVLVVDNGSTDGTITMLKTEYPHLRTIENTRNLGFSKAVNQGAVQSNGEYLAIINSDTMLSPLSLEQLVEYMDLHGETGAAGPQLKSLSGYLQYSGGFAPSPASALSYLLGVQAFFGHETRGLFVRSKLSTRAVSVDWLCAACLVVRRSAMEVVGLFDESHFLYAEDIEYGLRLKRAGWGLALLPWVQVDHVGGASSAQITEAKLLWLVGIFRVAGARLARADYFCFGFFLAGAFALRLMLMWFIRMTPARRALFSEHSASADFRKFALTAFRLSCKKPGFALDLAREIEGFYQKEVSHEPAA